MKRPVDPFKHNSTMTAKAVLVRSKADTIIGLCESIMMNWSEDITLTKVAMKIQVKADEIIKLVEDNQ